MKIKKNTNLIDELMGENVELVTDCQRIRPKKSEVLRLRCDNSKIKKLTGFSPSIGIREGLKRTIDWIIQPDYLIKYKADIYNV